MQTPEKMKVMKSEIIRGARQSVVAKAMESESRPCLTLLDKKEMHRCVSNDDKSPGNNS